MVVDQVSSTSFFFCFPHFVKGKVRYCKPTFFPLFIFFLTEPKILHYCIHIARVANLCLHILGTTTSGGIILPSVVLHYCTNLLTTKVSAASGPRAETLLCSNCVESI